MGALKLTYNQEKPLLKVVQGTFLSEKKGCAVVYRYGFNGMEKDDEVNGSGNSLDFGARIYDPRIGKMLSRDPLGDMAYPQLSPYNGMANNPITNIDYKGKLIIYFGGYWRGGDDKTQLENIQYWDVQLLLNAATTFRDFNAMFFNGSSSTAAGQSQFLTGEGSSAGDRRQEGTAAGTLYAMDIRNQLDAERKGNASARITSIGHSMGVSYSEGFLNSLLESTYPEGHQNAGQKMFNPADFGDWIALAPFQPEDIDIPRTVGTAGGALQFSLWYDPIAGSSRIPNLPPNNFVPVSKVGHFNSQFSSVFDTAPKGTTIRNRTPEGRGNSRGTGTPTPTPTPKGCTTRDICCFVAGTKVIMGNGKEKNIEDVKAGDTIKIVDVFTLQAKNSIVRETTSPIQFDIVNITFEDGTVNKNTSDHAYFIKGEGWASFSPNLTMQRYNIEAKQLKVGQLAYKMTDGKISEVKVIDIKEDKGERKTFNIYTQEDKGYYFANGFIVHNEGISDVGYLSVDSVYNTFQKKQKFDELKSQFLNIWLNDTNCYRGQSFLQQNWWKFYQKNTQEIKIGNILHTPNYDTLLILVSFYAVEYDKTDSKIITEDRTTAVGMGVTIDSKGNWNFRCDGGTNWLLIPEGNKIGEIEIQLKELILQEGYLLPNKRPNSKFWNRLYTDKTMWNNPKK
ncbi:MAG: hypothetical protein M3Q58_07565 [Bacteroidota bacterium]|nr:hypothetical protein [Bacteroidota bacterium]